MISLSKYTVHNFNYNGSFEQELYSCNFVVQVSFPNWLHKKYLNCDALGNFLL